MSKMQFLAGLEKDRFIDYIPMQPVTYAERNNVS